MEKAIVVPTPATWLPEDDILLKSAIEEGASLEALTKGAVPFSRKFTLQEVHDRWYALLYDAEVSAQACAHLFLDESDKPREIKEKHRKRKVGTLRKRYHERIKRIRNEYFGSSDLGFLTEPNLHSCTANRGDFHGQGILHDVPQVGDSVLRGCMTDPFGLQVTNSAMFHQAFPQVLTDLAAKNVVSHAADTFHSEGPNLLVSNRMSGTAKNDCLHGFPVVDLPFPVQGSLKIDGMPPFQSSINARNDIPHSLHDNYIDTGKCLQPGGEVSNNSIYALGFSPPLPSMTLWKTMEDIAAPDMPVNVVPGDKTRKAQDVSELPGNGGSKSKRADKQNGDNFINSASISGSDFADLPDSLFDFSTDDMLTMDVNRKDVASKSSCDNTPSSVPMGMDDIDTLKVGEKAMFVARAAIATEPEVATSHSPTVLAEVKPVSNIKVEMSSEPEVVTSYASPVLAELKTVPNIKVEKSSESTLNNKPIEPSQNFLYCALNTEDTEIPCNDDIFLLIHPDAPNTSATISITKSDMDPASAKERNCVQGLNSVEKNEELAQSSKSSLMFGSYMSEMVQVHTGSGITVKAELDDSCKDLAPRHKAVADPSQCKPTQTSLASVAGGNLDKDGKKVDSGAIETPSILGGLPMQIEAVGVNKILPGLEENPPPSDQEGSESENEDLHFSDIEAMILDMDLAPYDDDFYFSRKVSKYQQLNSKKAIMRMEQCARASLQRAMTFQGAVAILYSRRSKHFIRKPEVMLGRSTEETVVDIDLGKEERNNKISRRQAIIKMEHDGSFTLKNLAKNPMFVNGLEVGSGELIGLSSSCLIEIRGISFVFESNQKYVKSFRQKISMRNQGQMASFKLVPKQEGS